MPEQPPLWTPTKEQIQRSKLFQFIQYVNNKTDQSFSTYSQLYYWSIHEKEAFWAAFWDFSEVIGDAGNRVLVAGEDIEKATWFPDAQLNFAENLLRRRGNETAIHFQAEERLESSLSYDELHNQVAAVAAWLRAVGIESGDRIAGYLPNITETVVAMLATASVGAIWTSTSPDFGVDSVIDRFGQTTPKILFCANGYYYNGKCIDLSERISQIQSQLTTIEHCVVIDLTPASTTITGTPWQQIVEQYNGKKLQFTPMAFNDPLCILYSSGTTGKPKCIVHKVGGVLLQHMKEHQLHCDIGVGDTLFYFTTCGWMMWNWLVSGLASDAALVLYDGSPFYPDHTVLWRMAEKTGITAFGTSAKYIDQLKKFGVTPIKQFDLGQLRTILSTGSVLAPESFDYVYQAIKTDVCLSSISGGTDLISCFIIGSPILPVYRGECQCSGLGMATEVFDGEGRALVGTKGELVCTQTFPSQPAFFWNDANGEKYHRAYFSRYNNVWHHGDYVLQTERGGFIMYGRSDTTLNPGGVRIGTAEIYQHVEQIEEVMEALVIGQSWQNDERIVLFVVLRPKCTLDETLIIKIRQTIRVNCSPRHMPVKVVQVDAIPRTKSGKIVELAVRQVVHNQEIENMNSLANPEALEQFRNIPELQQE